MLFCHLFQALCTSTYGHVLTCVRACIGRSLLISDQAELNSELQQCVTWLQSYFCSAQSVSSLPFPALHHPLLQGGTCITYTPNHCHVGVDCINPHLFVSDSFTARVLRILQSRVQVGQTVSYKELSEMAGNPKAARAVGSVMRRNPVGSLGCINSSCRCKCEICQLTSSRLCLHLSGSSDCALSSCPV